MEEEALSGSSNDRYCCREPGYGAEDADAGWYMGGVPARIWFRVETYCGGLAPGGGRVFYGHRQSTGLLSNL